VDQQELLDLIETAAREGRTELDLSSKGLTELPPQIGQLIQLQSLNLRYNKLPVLPSEIGQLTQLHSLDLRNNQLTVLPSEIGQMTYLQSLDVSYNKLTALPPEIDQLTQLQSLSLRGNPRTVLSLELWRLTHLRSLNLQDNKLTALPPEIGLLIRLQSLDLSSNQLTALPPEIGQLTQLQSLDLFVNKLTALPLEIGQLTQLGSLNLRSNQLTALPPEIGQLTRLQSFNLSSNQLTTLPPEIGQMTCLQSLNVSYNKLTALPPEIGQLTQLQSLDLRNNRLTALPSQIGRLTRLPSLDLSFNDLTALPPEIGRLPQIQSLNAMHNKLATLPLEIGLLTRLQSLILSENRLTVLPPEIGRLTRLQWLTLSENRLTALPPEIGQLTQLQSLVLSVNRLMALPIEIGQLTQLRRLELHSNQLTALPPEIGQLTQLGSLNLQGNPLVALPPEIGQLTKLQHLDLRENPLPIPPEILTNYYDPQAIIHTYLDFLAGQRRPLNEVKMILVGQGSVGKTSLVNRLLDDTFDPHETKTEGISIRRWSISTTDLQSTELRINVWDFGGQEVMHATHQFFLTHRTLYLLVLDARLNEAENRLDYWLQIIQSFGGDSPIIVVGNKVDQQPLDIDRGGLQTKYPAVKAIVETSCASGDGILELRAAIANQIPTLPHVFDQLLTTWFDVKAQLEEMDANYISYAQYAQICQAADVTDERSQRTLLGFLHDLGIVLHFPDPRLETTNILNPEWVTQGVYRILNSYALFQSGGVLTWNLLTQILGSKEYPRDRHIFIVDMMRKFELCYPFPGQDHTYLVPDLLPKEERYTGEWDRALAFQVHYNVLPGSIISRFIVRMHRAIHQNTVWRTGVLLASDDNHALVKADYAEDRITISVRGPVHDRRELLTRIREQLDGIHHAITGLQTAEKVPLPGHPELPPVDYKWLRDMERKGIPEFLPPGLTDPISVRQLLDGVEPSARRTRRDSPVYNVDARGARIGVIGDDAEIQDGIHFESDKE
jgi:internalin A